MAVEVVAPAKDEHKFECLCENCLVTLRYVYNDITERIQRGYDCEVYYEIRCPACKYMNDVKQRPLVTNIWQGRVIEGRGYLPGEKLPNED